MFKLHMRFQGGSSGVAMGLMRGLRGSVCIHVFIGNIRCTCDVQPRLQFQSS